MWTLYRKTNGDEIIYDHTDGDLTYAFIRRNGKDYPPQIIDQLLARGYWEIVSDLKKYDENQPRDERGRFSSTAGETPQGESKNFEIGGDVSEVARLFAVQHKEELESRGLVAFGNATVGSLTNSQYSQSTKVMVMRDIAERMRDVPLEDVISATATFRTVQASGDMFDRASELELQEVMEDPMKGFLFDGVSMQIVDVDPLVQNSMRYDTEEEKETCLREFLAASLVENWAGTSNDESPESLALQEMAEQHFGIENAADWENNSQSEIDDIINQHGYVMGEFLQAQYEATQEFLSNNNTVEVTLHRGLTNDYSVSGNDEEWNIGDEVELEMRPLSSWSTSFDVSAGFGSNVLTATFPAERIFSLPITGLGCLNEAEVVVLGGVMNAEVTR